MSVKRALYAGSFDPFTNGHLSIVKEASGLFDEVFVVLARNTSKKRTTNAEEMRDAMEAVLASEGIDNCRVVILTDGLVADFCELCNAQYLVRGLRNVSDYLYEENIAKINQEINPNLRTIYLRASNDVISSSMVRELHEYGRDISCFVPEGIDKTLERR